MKRTLRRILGDLSNENENAADLVRVNRQLDLNEMEDSDVQCSDP
jgi:hypothetical protein